MGKDVFGIEVAAPPPDDWTVLEVVGAAKCLDSDGHVEFWTFFSNDLTPPEAFGMAHMLEHELEDELTSSLWMQFVEDDDDE
jgi:hypothetical protein